jgi:peptidyl-tRNA hydrolase
VSCNSTLTAIGLTSRVADDVGHTKLSSGRVTWLLTCPE